MEWEPVFAQNESILSYAEAIALRNSGQSGIFWLRQKVLPGWMMFFACNTYWKLVMGCRKC